MQGVQGAELLALAADPIRWKVLAQLTTGETCVCGLQAGIPVAANLLSYHLKLLPEAGLVTTTRRGRWIDSPLPVTHSTVCTPPSPASRTRRST